MNVAELTDKVRDMLRLEGMARQARELANQIFEHRRQGDACDCHLADRTTSCLEKEEKRPLTREEKSLGWTRRPFNSYRPTNMCCPCATYWYQEMAAQELHRLHSLKVMERAEVERKTN